MIKITPAEMHLLVLICANPQHPHVAKKLLESLGNEAKALAILFLQRHNPSASAGLTIPSDILGNEDKMKEIHAAVSDFEKLAKGRRREHQARMSRVAVA